MENHPRGRILVLADYYLPGWRAGGPIRSIGNMVAELGDRYCFHVITRDHDYEQADRYPDVHAGAWAEVGKALVFHGAAQHLRLRSLARVVDAAGADLIFANSVFSSLTRRYLVLRRMRRIPRTPVLIAPRGEFGSGALSIKSKRKKTFLGGTRVAGLFAGVDWQASGPAETEQILGRFPRATVREAPDIPRRPLEESAAPVAKRPGSVRLAFTARISPMKNLPHLLGILSELHGDVRIDLYGAKEHAEWRAVTRALRSLPGNVEASYHGVVAESQVDAALGDAHFSVLSSRGENFGHSVYEALRLGRPVVISDRTPWKGLSDVGAGWEVPLEDRAAWVSTLQECVDIDATAYHRMTIKAHEYAMRWFEDADPVARQAAVLDQLLSGRPKGSGLGARDDEA